MNNSGPEFPVISIVTPSYNQGAFLAETIESVIGQEGDFAIDYTIVDGGSSDDSVDIIRDYEARLHNGKWPVACRGVTLRWTGERDKGQTDALMKGFRMSQGEILAWLNSDDTYLPGALQIRIVGIKPGQYFTLRHAKALHKGIGLSFVPLTCPPQGYPPARNRPFPVMQASLIIPDNINGIVARTAVNDSVVNCKVAFLADDALDGFGQEGALVVGGGNDGDDGEFRA